MGAAAEETTTKGEKPLPLARFAVQSAALRAHSGSSARWEGEREDGGRGIFGTAHTPCAALVAVDQSLPPAPPRSRLQSPLLLLSVSSMASDASTAVPKGTAAALQLVKCKVSASLMPGNLVAGSVMDEAGRSHAAGGAADRAHAFGGQIAQHPCPHTLCHVSHCSSKHFAYIHRNEIALVEQRLVALGNEKAESTKVVYAEKEPINQVEFLKFAGLGEVLVAVNQGGGVFVSGHSTA